MLTTIKNRSVLLLNASRHFNSSLILSGTRFFWLFIFRRFTPTEIFALALLDPAITWKDLKSYQSKKLARPVYRTMNSGKGRLQIDDKDLFHQTCMQIGLATPPLAARITRETLAKLSEELSHGQESSYHDLLQDLPSSFVVKPSLGYQGAGILFFHKPSPIEVTTWDGIPLTAAEFVEHLAESFSAPTMPLVDGSTAEELRHSADKHVLMVQPALKSHESLRRLSDKELIQTLRICTILDDRDEPHIHFIFLKLLGGNNLQDNFHQGSNGNLLAYIDEQRGTISRVICRDPVSGITQTVQNHPETEISFEDYMVPFWPEACELAIKAARAFPQTRAVGWDIALTEDGPLLLEGNGTWDPVAPLYKPFPSPQTDYSGTTTNTGAA